MPLPKRKGIQGIYNYLVYGQKLNKRTIENLKLGRLTIIVLLFSIGFNKFTQRNMGPPRVSKLELEDTESESPELFHNLNHHNDSDGAKKV